MIVCAAFSPLTWFCYGACAGATAFGLVGGLWLGVGWFELVAFALSMLVPMAGHFAIFAVLVPTCAIKACHVAEFPGAAWSTQQAGSKSEGL